MTYQRFRLLSQKALRIFEIPIKPQSGERKVMYLEM